MAKKIDLFCYFISPIYISEPSYYKAANKAPLWKTINLKIS